MYFKKESVFINDKGLKPLYVIIFHNKKYCIFEKTLWKLIALNKIDSIVTLDKGYFCAEIDVEPIFGFKKIKNDE